MSDEALVYGSVHPIAGGWTFEKPIRIQHADGGATEVLIRQGRFQARISTELGGDPEDLINTLHAELQGLVDALGYHLAAALTVEIEGGFIAPNKALLMGRHLWPEAAGRTRDEPLYVDAPTLEPFTDAAASEPLVRLALSDIRAAIAQPIDTGFHAYRAVESARHWFQDLEPPTENPEEGWLRLRDAFGIEEQELRQLAALARQRRHGGVGQITEPDRLWSIALARRVVGALVARIAQAKRDIR